MNTRLQRENDELRMKMASLDRQSQMDHVAREDIGKQVKALETENIRLKEDLAFFQNLGTVPGKTEQRVSIGRLKLERGQLPGEYQYSLVLVQGGQRQRISRVVWNLPSISSRMVKKWSCHWPARTLQDVGCPLQVLSTRGEKLSHAAGRHRRKHAGESVRKRYSTGKIDADREFVLMRR